VFISGLEVLNIPGAIIIAIILATFVGINYMNCGTVASGVTAGCVTDLSVWTQPGGPVFPVNVLDIPSGKLTFRYAHTPFFWQCVWTFLFVELFDSFGTLTGIMTRCGFMNGDSKKDMARINRAMMVDGCGLWLGGIIGGNSITCFVESNTGVEAGARTGLASIFTGGAFLLSLAFIFPFIAIIPSAATTCALVMVGVHSLKGVNDINFNDFIDQLAAFFTIAIMGFTYSIANGICAGFIFFSWMRAIRWIQLQVCFDIYFNRS
jgi:AGZA family xanthine/uracil permease-like MFS transporter